MSELEVVDLNTITRQNLAVLWDGTFAHYDQIEKWFMGLNLSDSSAKMSYHNETANGSTRIYFRASRNNDTVKVNPDEWLVLGNDGTIDSFPNDELGQYYVEAPMPQDLDEEATLPKPSEVELDPTRLKDDVYRTLLRDKLYKYLTRTPKMAFPADIEWQDYNRLVIALLDELEAAHLGIDLRDSQLAEAHRRLTKYANALHSTSLKRES